MLGGLDISRLNDAKWTRRDVEKIEIHPDFGKTWRKNFKKYDADIAVITLKTTVEMSIFIRKICLPPGDVNVDNQYGNVVGHGRNENHQPENIPKFINISSISSLTCVFNDTEYIYDLSERGFCAGDPGQIPCKFKLIHLIGKFLNYFFR